MFYVQSDTEILLCCIVVQVQGSLRTCCADSSCRARRSTAHAVYRQTMLLRNHWLLGVDVSVSELEPKKKLNF